MQRYVIEYVEYEPTPQPGQQAENPDRGQVLGWPQIQAGKDERHRGGHETADSATSLGHIDVVPVDVPGEQAQEAGGHHDRKDDGPGHGAQFHRDISTGKEEEQGDH